MNAKDVAIRAMDELFGDKDPGAVDRWLAGDYRQHSLAPDGPEGTRQIVATFHEGVRYERVRALADGDLVALHGIYHGFGPTPFVAFDLLRVDANGKLAEHWDALTPLVADTASGRSQTDGPTTPRDLDKTEANRSLVVGFAEKVLKGGDDSVLTDYISADTYAQHNPEAADGLDGFGAAAATWAEQGKQLVYTTIHKVVAEGDFVLLVSEGEFGVPVAYWDLFRVADGKIVEHWDVVAPIPSALPHDNGVF
ncbi:MAG: nuclear transport factor 2 family protein [Actinomycetota bacterium]|nr:nuclear transport factor 2 family protein [Actinomycetota bacterium]